MQHVENIKKVQKSTANSKCWLPVGLWSWPQEDFFYILTRYMCLQNFVHLGETHYEGYFVEILCGPLYSDCTPAHKLKSLSEINVWLLWQVWWDNTENGCPTMATLFIEEKLKRWLNLKKFRCFLMIDSCILLCIFLCFLIFLVFYFSSWDVVFSTSFNHLFNFTNLVLLLYLYLHRPSS